MNRDDAKEREGRTNPGEDGGEQTVVRSREKAGRRERRQADEKKGAVDKKGLAEKKGAIWRKKICACLLGFLSLALKIRDA